MYKNVKWQKMHSEFPFKSYFYNCSLIIFRFKLANVLKNYTFILQNALENHLKTN
jgi:hypothetical protein